ncbi:MAG: cysteine desulfurase NifS [Firmicutes bacterium]|nr:cysteine desulfurase NifS [Bacillota bacterium]
MIKHIYLDNAATTPVDEVVLNEMLPFFTDVYANPASQYYLGRQASEAVENARKRVADVLGCAPTEVYFTSSGTEANNWAIRGVAFANKDKGNHIITTKVEHHSVLNVCKQLQKEGFEVTYLDVDSDGQICLKQLKDAIKDTTILVSIMAANNEVGTLYPIKEIGKVIAKANKDAKRSEPSHKIYFHTDAVQAIGAVKICVKECHIDLLSLSAHKINGPKGCGALVVRNGVRVGKLIYGGAQERNKRAGTHNMAGIVGLGKAIELAEANREKNAKDIAKNRDYLIQQIRQHIPYTRLNGCAKERLPNNVSFCFYFIEGEGMLIHMDLLGIYCSTGSACASGSLAASHVLVAMGVPIELAHGSIRFTLSKKTTKEELDITVEKLKGIVEKLRAISPLYTKEARARLNDKC